MAIDDEEVGLRATPDRDMSTEFCQQAVVDWGSTNGHYDSRLVRTCLPGKKVESDPGGDNAWEEPEGFCSPILGLTCRDIGGMKIGAGVAITDNLVFSSKDDFGDTADCPFVGGAPIPAQSSMYVKIRTQYQSGALKYNDGGDPTSAGS